MLTVVGVRHHSPACARLVAHVIARERPRHVLIEGPLDMNDRLDELRLAGHRLPIAVFSYCTDALRSHASWTPFCDYSPEWVALLEGTRVGAQVRFMDLPAFHHSFHDVANRYADRHLRFEARLCERLGVSDIDSMWDHLFEQPMPLPDLETALIEYFSMLRHGQPDEGSDSAREACMRAFIGRALADGGPVVAVCGGFHRPALLGTPPAPHASGEWPAAPPPPAEARVGSYLVPFSFHRLDSFAGYASGMPSPQYYQTLWECGAERAAEHLLEASVKRLRARKQPVSAADSVVAMSMARGLQCLRGHSAMARVDVLDGLASALLKDALETPLPWTRRGTLGARTDPAVVEIVAAFSGERVGTLDAATPRPPLLADIKAELEAHDLTPAAAARVVRLQLDEPASLARSRVLHRLRVLGLPGFERQFGPTWATEGTLHELWSLQQVFEFESRAIEAAAHGPTLATAAAACLEQALHVAGGHLRVLAALLMDAAFIGIDMLSGSLLRQVSDAVGVEPHFDELGGALAALLGLYCFDRLLGAARSPALGMVIGAAYERGLWLFEGIRAAGSTVERSMVDGVVALHDALSHAGDELDLNRPAGVAVMLRRGAADDTPPALRGAAVGFCWRQGAADVDGALQGLRAMMGAEALGDFLLGLFTLARELVLHSESATLLYGVDDAIALLTHEAFLVALPSLRLAFAWFPPAEREQIAKLIFARYGARPGSLRLNQSPLDVAAAMAHEQAVVAEMQRYGLWKGPIETTERTESTEVVDDPSVDSVHSVVTNPAPANPEVALIRWRLILGEAADQALGSPQMSPDALGCDAALGWLYEREADLAGRDILPERRGGREASRLSVPEWINAIHELFPRQTIERLERDAVERYGIDEVVTNPEVLDRIEPNSTLLTAVLRTKHLMNPEVLEKARHLVRRVVEQLMEKLARDIQNEFSGTRNRHRRTRRRSAHNFDALETIRRNLRHYDIHSRRLFIQTPYFVTRSRRDRVRWQIILLIDESGSMLGSVLHAAVMAACLWHLPGLKTHLCIFDTSVVDLTESCTDPVETLMKVQLGGGTNIAQAVAYGAQLIENPRQTIVVLVTDFFEGGNANQLVGHVKHLSEQGTKVLGLAALDETANPSYDRALAARLVEAGAHVAAMTPGELARWMSEVIGGAR